MRDAVDERRRCPLEDREYVREARFRVVACAGGDERVVGAAGGDERRDAARDDDRDRRHLLLGEGEVAQQLAIEGPHQRTSCRGQPARVALDGDDPSIGQPQHPVGHPRDGRVVRDDHRGRAELCVDARDHLQDDLPGLVVEGPGRLVAEQDIGALGDRARHRDALLLAARQLGREVVEPVREPDQRERVRRVHRIGRDVGHQRDVLARGEARDQIVELEHEADVLAPEARQLRLVRAAEVVVEEVGLAARRDVESAQDVQQGRLAAARGPQEHDELRGVDVEIDPAQRVHLDLAEPVHLREAARDQHRRSGLFVATASVHRPAIRPEHRPAGQTRSVDSRRCDASRDRFDVHQGTARDAASSTRTCPG